MKSQNYSGTGSGPRHIEVGFQPDVLIIDSQTSTNADALITTSTMAGKAKAIQWTDAATTAYIQSLDPSGFTVRASHPQTNASGTSYHYVAFKAGAGSLAVGYYDGDNAGSRSIPVAFQPSYVIVIPDSALTTQNVVQYTDAMGCRNFYTSTCTDGTGGILGLDINGFRVGNSTNTNATGTRYHWIAWGGGSGQVAVGSYSGNDTGGRSFATGWFPEWVVVNNSNTSTYGPVHKPASTGVGTTNTSLRLYASVTEVERPSILPDGHRVRSG